jgi:two-component sensor histidine kinase
VEVRWTTVEGQGGPWLELEWRERGGPAVAPPERRGFGLRLVERNIVHDLGGGADLRFDPLGLRAALRFALA